MFPVQRLCGAEVHGDSMLDDAILLKDLVEHLEGATSVDHIVFGDDLKPVDDGLPGKDMFIVRDAKTDSHPVVGKSIEAICWHIPLRSRKDIENWRLEISQASRQSRKLGPFRRLGAIRSATALALAIILTGGLATALCLTVILNLAAVLCNRLFLTGHARRHRRAHLQPALLARHE